MEYSVIIDKRQAVWLVQEIIKKLSGHKPSTFLVSRYLDAPAFALNSANAILLQGNIPEKLLPFVLNHEELHLLIYNMFKDKGYEYASKLSKFLDDTEFNKALCEVLGVSYQEVIEWLDNYMQRTSLLGMLLRWISRILSKVK